MVDNNIFFRDYLKLEPQRIKINAKWRIVLWCCQSDLPESICTITRNERPEIPNLRTYLIGSNFRSNNCQSASYQQGNGRERKLPTCPYSRKVGHTVALCWTKQLNEFKASNQNKPQNKSSSKMAEWYKSFIFEGFISVASDHTRKAPLTILRDMGGSQSLMLRKRLPHGSGSKYRKYRC